MAPKDEEENGPPEGPDEVRVLWSDDHLAVVDKPAGLVVHRAPSHSGPTLVDRLSGTVGGGDADRPGIVHRLDRDTSGLMLVGRTDEAVSELQRLIAAREVERVYLALVEGRPRSRTGKIEAPIGRSTRDRHRMAVGGAASRPAATAFEVLEVFSRTSLLRLRLETGRTHQIRVHLQAIGHPVVGDPEYGRSMTLGLDRQFLHSQRLGLVHPVTGEPLRFESELRADLNAALARARSE